MKIQDAKIVFFGTPEMSVWVLEEMQKSGIMPAVIITAPDAKAGRGRVLTPPPVKVWAESQGTEVLQPSKIDADFIAELGNTDWDAFIVFAYGKILPRHYLMYLAVAHSTYTHQCSHYSAGPHLCAVPSPEMSETQLASVS